MGNKEGTGKIILWWKWREEKGIYEENKTK